MGPIRAFIRPSHAAAPEHSAASSSLFCPTQQQSSAFPGSQHHLHHHHHHHRPYCAHVTPPSFASQHHPHHPTRQPLFAAAAAAVSGSTSDPLRVGLVSSNTQPCLYHQFEKLLPPGAPLSGPLPVLTALSNAQGEGVRAETDRDRKGRVIWEGSQKECKFEGKVKGVRDWTKDKNEYSQKKIFGEFKWKKDSGQNKWKSSNSICIGESKLQSSGYQGGWKITQEDEQEEEINNHQEGPKDRYGTREEKCKKEKATPLTACLSSLLTKHDEPLPSTSSHVALVFPFSEDEEDDEGEEEDGCNEGTVPGGEGRRVTWPISDIVETEDEEGELLQNETEKRISEEEEHKFHGKQTGTTILKVEEQNVFRVDKDRSAGKIRLQIDETIETEGNASEENNHKEKEDEAKEAVYEWRLSDAKDLNDSSRGKTNLVSVVIKHPHIRVPERGVGVGVNVPKTGSDREGEWVKHSGNSSHVNVCKKGVNTCLYPDNESSQVNREEGHCSAVVHLNVNTECKSRKDEEEEDEEDVERGDEEEEDEEERGDERDVVEGDTHKDGVRATQRLRPRSYRQFLLTRERRSRAFLKERSYHLGRWFVTHFTHPYPSKEQKNCLAAKTKMTRNQVSEWFGNMRRRIREATRGSGKCWEERVRMYNSVITGKSEPLPILPDDDINTWVAPVPQDPPSNLDPQEEFSASPKFKTALLHRYLNNSDAGVFSVGDGSLDSYSSLVTAASMSSTTYASARTDPAKIHEDGSSGTSLVLDVLNRSFPNNQFTHILPLCTSSPKENIKELWNNSFENIKDNYLPSLNSRMSFKEQKTRPGPSDTPDDSRKIIRKLGVSSPADVVVGPANKKPRITVVPTRDWFQRPSTSKSSADESTGGYQVASEGEVTFPRSQIIPVTKVPLSYWSIRRPVIEHSRSIEDSAIGEGHLRQPEELAAAYTLMELQHM